MWSISENQWIVSEKWNLEPLILLFASVVALLFSIFNRLLSQKESRSNHDIRILNWITSTLQPFGAIRFLRTYEFSKRTFQDNVLTPIFHFPAEVATAPLIKFHNPDLEKAWYDLQDSIDSFKDSFAHNTFPVRGALSLQEIPPEWEYEQPERYGQALKELNLGSLKVVESYDRVISLGFEILGVSPPLPTQLQTFASNAQ